MLHYIAFLHTSCKRNILVLAGFIRKIKNGTPYPSVVKNVFSYASLVGIKMHFFLLVLYILLDGLCSIM